MEDRPDKELTLSYVGHVAAASRIAQGRANRALGGQAALSIVVIGLCAGLVSAAENVTISGLEFRLSSWVLLVAGAALILAFQAAYVTQALYSLRMEVMALELYRRLGLDAVDLDDASRSPFASFTGRLVAGTTDPGRPARLRVLFDWPVTLVVFVGLVVLPVAAQAAAMCKLAATYGWAVHIWLPFGLLLLVTGSTPNALRRGIAEETDPVRRWISRVSDPRP